MSHLCVVYQALPISPSFATALLRSRSFGVQPQLLTIVAMLSVEEVFTRGAGGVLDAKGFAVYEGASPVPHGVVGQHGL